MSDESAPLPRQELEQLGLYDPNAADGADRLELIRYVLALGATLEEVAAAANLGELALDVDLRPRGPLTLGKVIEALPIESATATRLLTALGMTTDLNEPITAEEGETIQLFVASLRLLGEEAAVQLARVTGSAMAKVAETLVGGFRIQVELPRLESGVRYVDVVKEYSDIIHSLLPAFVRSLDALLRQQILAVAKRMWSTDEEHSTVTLVAYGWIRRPGRVHRSDRFPLGSGAGGRAHRLRRAHRTSRTAGNGQVVKMIGDEAMFVTEDPADACQIALDLVATFGENQTPPVRVGLATGEMVSVLGDLYGPDVNLAARLVTVAEPETVVVSQRTQDGAPEFLFHALPPRTLKGFPDSITSFPAGVPVAGAT